LFLSLRTNSLHAQGRSEVKDAARNMPAAANVFLRCTQKSMHGAMCELQRRRAVVRRLQLGGMVMIRTGDRIARDAPLRIGCNAAVFDEQRRVLVVRREDNGLWCFPGGGMNSGESVAEACEREVREETGLSVEALRLIAIYSSPHQVSEYTGGDRFHSVDLVFEARVVSGRLAQSDETTELRFCTRDELVSLPMHPQDAERVRHAFDQRSEAYFD
jgi:ADP-ribose pyrophosphatase YjhB (NUDIX family)